MKLVSLLYILVAASGLLECISINQASDPARFHLYWGERTDVGSPGPRFGHALAYDSDRGVTVLFGGYNHHWFDDTWEYDGSSWKRITIDGPGPEARFHHAMCYDNALHQVILFGGASEDEMLNDVWDYESTGPQRGRWIYRPEAIPPSARKSHTMIFDYFAARAVVAGGMLNSEYAQTSEVWKFDNSTGQWFLQPTGIGFSGGQKLGAGLTDHMMLYDSARHETVVIGGIGPYGTVLVNSDKIWFPGAGKGPLDCGSGITQGAIVYDRFHDIYFQFGGKNKYDEFSQGMIWYPSVNGFPCSYSPSDLDTEYYDYKKPRVIPANRRECAMVYDDKRHVTVLFGGLEDSAYGDTWELYSHDRQETWADFGYGGREVGTFNLPFNTVAKAIKDVQTGGMLRIKAGSTPETVQITKAMIVRADGGSVIIGRR